MEPFRGQALWVDLNNYTVSSEPIFSDNQIVRNGQDADYTETLPKYEGQLIKATGWIFHPDGMVELVAVFPNPNWYRPVDCQEFSQ